MHVNRSFHQGQGKVGSEHDGARKVRVDRMQDARCKAGKYEVVTTPETPSYIVRGTRIYCSVGLGIGNEVPSALLASKLRFLWSTELAIWRRSSAHTFLTYVPIV